MGRKETETAIQQARAGNLKRANRVEELMAELHADDEAPGVPISKTKRFGPFGPK